MAVGRCATVSRQVLEDRQYSSFEQPGSEGASNGGNLLGSSPISAVTDHRIGVGHSKVTERQAIGIYAQWVKIGGDETRAKFCQSNRLVAVAVIDRAVERSRRV